MPGFDGTGPMGYGPMTGRRRGQCAGAADFTPAGPGAGYRRRTGQGRGGRGYRNQYYATGLTGWQRAQMGEATGAPTPPEADRLDRLEQRLDEVLARLAGLERAE